MAVSGEKLRRAVSGKERESLLWGPVVRISPCWTVTGLVILAAAEAVRLCQWISPVREVIWPLSDWEGEFWREKAEVESGD